ncbi:MULTISPECIES: hypothetical protein [unclassified Thioalkalivibrio]|uniref:hypothetical protein n=1 Tax=unclassified Thioalkalivibrio TaxID=2621013 RepID=UPI00036D5AF7|nr:MULTISPECIES: hypothetical protein [unclassified Thioalkalivibrio]
MHDRKSLSLAAELRRNMRAEFPAVARLSVSDPDFMETILDYAARSQSSLVQAAALTLRSQLEGSGYLHAPRREPPAGTDAAPSAGGRPTHKRRVYRGRVIDDPE